MRRLLEPILYRLGYVHHDTTIQGVTTWHDGEVIRGRVTGYLWFPPFYGAHIVEFEGVIVDPEDDE